MQKEIEITYLIKDLTHVEEKLLGLGAVLTSTKILNRDIYQDGGDYFFRVSEERANDKVSFYLTLKSDGNANTVGKIKNTIELEREFSNVQIKTLINMIKLLGFKKTNSYQKTRKTYKLLDCECCLDIMDNQTYLEIEFSNKKNLEKIINNIKDYIIK